MKPWILFAAAAAAAGAGPELISVEKIWDKGNHNAFTDLIRFRDQWFCAFREADDHVGGDGRIRVLVSRDGRTWRSAAAVAENGIDLRDPKLSLTPDGRLMLVMGGSVYNGTKVLKGRQPRVAFSKDGSNWTAPARVMGEGDWLWRVTWRGGRAYGVSYDHRPAGGAAGDAQGRGPEWVLKFVESRDGLQWSELSRLNVPGRPNETTLRFLPNGDAVALIRREGSETHPDQQAWIGVARAPYKEWTFKPAGHRLGGPNFLILPDGRMIAGGRDYRDSPRNRTAIGPLTLDGYTPMLLLPSAGDNSYPGFVWHDGILWMSYYSTHEGKTSIYLAKIRL